MNILGISFLSDASAAVIVDGKLVSAISEERLNRRKLWYGFPEEAIDHALHIAGLELSDIDYISTHGLTPEEPDVAYYEYKKKLINESNLTDKLKQKRIAFIEHRFEHETRVIKQRTPNYLATVERLNRPVKLYTHHHAHAASAFYGSGWEQCLAVTLDGWGEDGSGTVWECKKTEAYEDSMNCLSINSTLDSLGYFYGSITKTLGFIPHRHEGKVLGLAAYCENPRSYDVIRSMVDVNLEKLNFIGRVEKGLYIPHFDNLELQPLIRKYGRNDIAAAVQKTLEEVVCLLISSLNKRAEKVVLAGGVFANVKLNQKISELDNVEEVYVFPNMGDGGLAVGAAWLAHHELTDAYPDALETMYLGSEIEDDTILDVLSASGLKYKKYDDIHKKIAELLADGNVVARCSGRMEFGPRALGHRSILYEASDPEVNTWLNEKLNRSEFMPFAPATLEVHADDYYFNLKKGVMPAKYMAMTFKCKEKMIKEAPAAVHVDKTARPQIINDKDHPDFHGILTEYHKITGLSNLINTSFNMHEEPIVCSAMDAIRAFTDGNLPFLALEDYLVTNS